MSEENGEVRVVRVKGWHGGVDLSNELVEPSLHLPVLLATDLTLSREVFDAQLVDEQNNEIRRYKMRALSYSEFVPQTDKSLNRAVIVKCEIVYEANDNNGDVS